MQVGIRPGVFENADSFRFLTRLGPALAAMSLTMAAQAGGDVTVSGTITEGDGTPIEGATVMVGDINTNLRFRDKWFGETDADGQYTITVEMDDVGERDVVIEAAGPNHAPKRYQGPAEPLSCFFRCGGPGGEITIEAGDPPLGDKDIVLEEGGHLSGNIANADTGDPLESAFMQPLSEEALRFSPQFWGEAGPEGDYQTGLAMPDGEYFLRAGPPPGENFVIQAWEDFPCEQESCPILSTDTVQVQAGQNVTGLDFALSPGAMISGTLQPADIGRIVRIYSAAGVMLRQLVSPFDIPDAEWSVDGLAGGSYYVELGPFTGVSPKVRVLHNGLLCPFGGCNRARGDPLEVSPGSELSGIDIILIEGGQVKGEIVDAADGTTPTFDSDTQSHTFDIIDASGAVVGGGAVREEDGNIVLLPSAAVPPGNYYVRTFNSWLGRGIGYNHGDRGGGILPGFADAVYTDEPCAGKGCDLSAATPVTISTGSVSEITLEISAGSNIFGSVTDSTNQNPIPDAVVKLVDADNELLAATLTDGDGAFDFGAFPQGDYYLRTSMSGHVGEGFRPVQNAYFDQVYGAAEVCVEALCDPTEGDVVELEGDADAGPFELEVEPGPVIEGQITESLTGLPINRGRVNVFDEDGNFVGEYRVDQLTGRFQTTALPPGTYTLSPEVSPAFNAVGIDAPDQPQGSQKRPFGRDTGPGGSGFEVVMGNEDVVVQAQVVDRVRDRVFTSDFEGQ